MIEEPPPPRRRIPGLGAAVALAFLLVPIGAVAWWLNRPKTDAGGAGPALPDLDVVCLGRIDGLNPATSLEPSVPGRVTAVLVSEGQHVGAKAELLRLDDEALQLRVEEAKAAVAGADVEVEAARLDQKLYPLRKSTQEAAITAAAGRVSASRRLVEEKKKAESFGTVTAAEIIAAEAELRQFEQLEGMERAKLKELESADPGLKVRAAEAKKLMAEITLKQAGKAVRDCVLVAPVGGTVLRVLASVGEAVAPGTPQPPVVFLPDGPRVVRAELEQEFLGRVRVGMRATIRDDARADSPVWHGQVVRVGQVVARKRLMVLEPGELNDVRTVECVVSLDGSAEGLLVGQRMRVRIGRGE
jgi:multidrug resistance efflux pump